MTLHPDCLAIWQGWVIKTMVVPIPHDLNQYIKKVSEYSTLWRSSLAFCLVTMEGRKINAAEELHVNLTMCWQQKAKSINRFFSSCWLPISKYRFSPRLTEHANSHGPLLVYVACQCVYSQANGEVVLFFAFKVQILSPKCVESLINILNFPFGQFSLILLRSKGPFHFQ